jgi:hypothetical protein
VSPLFEIVNKLSYSYFSKEAYGLFESSSGYKVIVFLEEDNCDWKIIFLLLFPGSRIISV